MKKTSPSPSAARRSLGFTLVELLVAVALGLLLMIALIAVYLNVSRTNSEMYKTNGVIENGRFAIDVLNEDLSHGGYWGGYVPVFDNFSARGITPGDVPSQAAVDMGPCAAYAAWTTEYRSMLLGVPVQVFGDGVPTGCDTTDLIKDRVAGTDVLVVRHAETCSPGDANCEALNTAKVYLQISQCASQITAGNSYVLGNVPANFTLQGRSCAAPVMPLRKFVSNIYYIRSWATTEGDGVPTLVRSTFGLRGGLPAHEVPAQALIEGIERFNVELGIDSAGRCAGHVVDYTKSINLAAIAAGGTLVATNCAYNAASPALNTLPTVRGDGVPESYVRCPATGCTAVQLRDVVAVKLYVLARTKEPSPGYQDERTYAMGLAGTFDPTPVAAGRDYKRHLFQTTVRLTNVSGRRETPTP